MTSTCTHPEDVPTLARDLEELCAAGAFHDPPSCSAACKAKWSETKSKDCWLELVSAAPPALLHAVQQACYGACQDDVGKQHPGAFEHFGYDFMLDEALVPWLIEANASCDLCEAPPAARARFHWKPACGVFVREALCSYTNWSCRLASTKVSIESMLLVDKYV